MNRWTNLVPTGSVGHLVASFAAAILCLAVGGRVALAQPANDACAAAIVVGAPSTTAGTNVAATQDGTSSCAALGDTKDVWYALTAPATGVYQIDTEGSTGLTDTTLAVFSACGGSELACDDDSGTGLLSELLVSLTAGQNVRIRVAGYDGAVGSFVLHISGPNPTAPNDLCANAIPLILCVEHAQSNRGAGTEGATNCATSSADIFYSFTPSVTGSYEISLCPTTADLDTVLSVHSGCPATAANQIACNDDFCGRLSQVTTVLSSGVTYIIRVASSGSGGGFVPPIDIIICQAAVSGACCQPDGHCYQAAGKGACITTAQPSNMYKQGLSCTPEGCCPNSGACCISSMCSLKTSAECTALGGDFKGPCVPCSPEICIPLPPPPPSYDHCATGLVLTADTAVLASNIGATSDQPNSSCAFQDNLDVWFTFTAPASDTYQIDTIGPIGTTPLLDTTLAVYLGCTGVEVACNDDVGGGPSMLSQVIVNLSAGLSYQIRVSGWNHATGQFVLRLFRKHLGACCNISGDCYLAYQFVCGGPSSFQGHGVVCTPSPCPAMGACCQGSTCTILTASACTVVSGTFLGGATTCVTAGHNSCCRADYNLSGSITVQDIFDFLAGYFAGDSRADFNGVGGITVQDIFDFLAAYFAGCP